jgi:hypothetical protein
MSKCPECQGTGWYRGRQEYRAVQCPECLGNGFIQFYSDPWDEEEIIPQNASYILLMGTINGGGLDATRNLKYKGSNKTQRKEP